MNKENTHNNKIILLAEDDKYISQAYKDGLARAGFKVVTAFDGLEAIKKAKQVKPDIILLDIILPRLDGFEVLKRLKADDGVKDVPVLIISNLGQDSDIEKGKELGAADYLIKANWSMREVIKKINKSLDVEH